MPARTNRLTRKTRGEADDLLAKIRRLALQQQKDHPQVFLSMRDAAKHFAVPLSAMAAVYKQLTEEGILSGIRASRTILRARGAFRTLKVRGVVGMPLSIWRFQTLTDYQRCFKRTQDELHHRGFLTNTLFFEQPEGLQESVIESFRKEKVDSVVWLLPDGADADTVLRLHDLGIPFVGVNTTPLAGVSCRYEIRRHAAIRTIARSWRDDPQIASATIVRVVRETSADEERLNKLQAIVQSEQIECQIATVEEESIGSFLKSLSADKSAGVILPGAAAALLGWRAPETLTNMLPSCRIALIDGPMYMPLAETAPEARVDLITADWAQIAKRIVDDFVMGEVFDDSSAVGFEAKAHLRVLLSEFPPGSRLLRGQK